MGLFSKKSLDLLMREAEGTSGEPTLKRTLGALNLTLLGIGAIIGAGIFVLTGTAAAQYAGNAIVLSFVLAGHPRELRHPGLQSGQRRIVFQHIVGHFGLGHGATHLQGWPGHRIGSEIEAGEHG